MNKFLTKHDVFIIMQLIIILSLVFHKEYTRLRIE